MELTIIGASGTYPSPGGACNSYLLRSGGTTILLDLGPASLSRLFTVIDPADVKALFISHLHPDHFIDIYPYRYYLQFSADSAKLPLLVYAPPGAADKLTPLFSDKNKAALESVFSWRGLKDGVTCQIGDLEVTPYEVEHLKPTFSLLVKAPSGAKLYYTADTAYDERLAERAAGVDLFLCEATLRRRDRDGVAHLSGEQAGELAERAGVARLVLTHLWPHFDSREILNEARGCFSGPVDLAVDGRVYKIKPSATGKREGQ